MNQTVQLSRKESSPLQKSTRKPGLGRDFNRFWLGSLASNLGDGMMVIALPLVAALITNDPLLVSGLIAARSRASGSRAGKHGPRALLQGAV